MLIWGYYAIFILPSQILFEAIIDNIIYLSQSDKGYMDVEESFEKYRQLVGCDIKSIGLWLGS